MSSEPKLKEHATDVIEAFKDKVNAEEARRLYLNGKRYVKTHPVAAMALSLSAGILLGYLAKALVDRRHNGEAHAGL